jgi:hypothetical protein
VTFKARIRLWESGRQFGHTYAQPWSGSKCSTLPTSQQCPTLSRGYLCYSLWFLAISCNCCHLCWLYSLRLNLVYIYMFKYTNPSLDLRGLIYLWRQLLSHIPCLRMFGPSAIEGIWIFATHTKPSWWAMSIERAHWIFKFLAWVTRYSICTGTKTHKY